MSPETIGGDSVGGDKVTGDKAGRDIIKDVEVQAGSGSAISFGGNAEVNTYIDAAGNVIVQHQISHKEAARNQRIRKHLLDQLQATWLEGILENSIHEAARIDLGLESEPEAVERPWVMSLERPNQEPKTLPPTSKILDSFRDLGGSMLILGEPGSGKTFTLLELARELRYIALADKEQPIPLVFNLSSWAQERQPLLHWLVGDLFQVYGVGRKQAPEWLKTMPFHLLLDGLDEVAAEYRDACVTAINTFREEYGPVNVVVCCRIEEHEQLTNRLQLMGSAVIQPLNQTQINNYLSTAGGPLLTQLVNDDSALQELAQTPLTLTIIALAYHNHPPDQPLTGTTQQRRHHLFTTYVNRMFQRRRPTTEIHKTQSIHYLNFLAARMQEHDQTTYYIEKMQPSWIGNFYKLFTLVNVLIGGLIGGLIIGLGVLLISEVFSLGQLGDPEISWVPGWLWNEFDYSISSPIVSFKVGKINSLTIGILVGAIIGQIFGPRKISLTETLVWSWRRGLKRGLIVGPIGGITFGMLSVLFISIFGGISDARIFGLINGLNPYLDVYLNVFLVGWLLGGLIIGLFSMLIGGLSGKELQVKSNPNQGIKLSGRNALTLGLLVGLSFGIISWIFGRQLGRMYYSEQSNELLFGLIGSLIGGVLGGFSFGGLAFLNHYALRFLLARVNNLPFKLEPFLDEMVDRILLRKVGGGYIFIHRMLLEYFASLEDGP